MRDPIVREFLLAFWKIHILHHAGEQGVYGQWMLEELHHHGYRLSPGTLYPMLSRMAQRGWLKATEPTRSTGARVYRLTPRGLDVLTHVLESLDELYREVGRRDSTDRRSGTTRANRRQKPNSKAARITSRRR